MDSKAWFQSKTLWANLIAGAVTIAGVFGLDLGLDETMQAQLVAGVMVVVNIVLRLVTDKPIAPK
jgi:hypothetical protein